MPPVAVHFNGGVNLPDAETVFRALVERVPDGLRRLPDGEPGERAGWIGFQIPKLSAADGLEWEYPDPEDTDPYAGPMARLVPGTEPEGIDWPDLGYAGEYIESYRVFSRLRDEGVVPPGLRMQVEYPTPTAVSQLFHPDDRDRLRPAYAEALLADLSRLLDVVPHEDLAVQWDAAVETVGVEWAPESADAVGASLAALLDGLPDGVPGGLHLCYGDAGHQHMVEPESLQTQVRLANAVAEHAAQPPAWLSFTVPQDRGDEDYFEPLAQLRTEPATELYFALVPYHPDTQEEGTTAAQVAFVDRHLPDGPGPWGICTECGMARAERDDIARLLDLHREILASFGVSTALA